MTEQATGLALWRQRIAGVSLPLLSGPESIEKLLSAGVSLQEVAHLLADDPALALEMIIAAARLPAVKGEVHGLQHSLNLLGIRRVQSLIRARASRLMNPDSPSHRASLQAITVSRLAASLVNRWAEKQVAGSGEFLSCVALLIGLARWKLPLAAPRVQQAIDVRVARGERRSRVEQAVLGCSMNELNRAVLQDAGFPEEAPLLQSSTPDPVMLAKAARSAWTETMAPELQPEVARWLRQRTSPPLIAHLLAWAGHDGWYEGRCLQLLKVVSALNNHPLDRVIPSTHRTAVIVSRRLERFSGVIHSPAEQLFWTRRPPRSLLEPSAKQETPQPKAPPPTAAAAPVVTAPTRAAAPQTVTAELAPLPRRAAESPVEAEPVRAAPKAPPSPVPSSPTDPSVLPAFVARCRAYEFDDLRQLMSEASLALEKGLGLRRSLFFLRPGNSDQLRCYLKHGLHDAAQNLSLDIPFSPANLLTKLVEQGGSVRVDALHGVSAIKQLPPGLRVLASPSGFVMTSIKLNEKAIGAIWADSGIETVEVHARQYDVFRVLTGHFNTTFTHLTRKIKK